MDIDLIVRILAQTACASFIAVAFAMLFQVPFKLLPLVALGGAIVRFSRTLLFEGFHTEIVVATFIATIVMSMMFIFISPKINVPRQVFCVASIISLIPGMDAYSCLIGLSHLIDATPSEITPLCYEILHHGMRCFSIMLAISFGIAIPPIFFYRNRYRRR